MSTPPTQSRLHLRYSGFEDYVEILVDDEPLAERLMAAERQIHGAYVYDDTGLGWHLVDCWPSTVFDREAHQPGTRTGLLFTCGGCNCCGCGDTVATVTTIESSITFSGFSRPKTPLPAVEPVTFDLAQFIAEVDRTNNWYTTTWPNEHRRKAERRAQRPPTSPQP